MERGGAAATTSAAGAKVFGDPLWNFKRGGAPPVPPLDPLVVDLNKYIKLKKRY